MEASFNDNKRYLDIERGLITGVGINRALFSYTHHNNRSKAVCETIALYHLVAIRLGLSTKGFMFDWSKIGGALVNKWLGDTRCPMCDKYWRSGQPQNIINFVKNAKNDLLAVERCSECGNTANETIMENGVLV